MDGTVQTPRAAARVAAYPSVNGNGAARHLHDEWLEEYEAGVYMKLKDLGDGTRELKRVRFSKRRFGEHQAEKWWKENHEKVYERYNVRSSQQASSAASTHSASARPTINEQQQIVNAIKGYVYLGVDHHM